MFFSQFVRTLVILIIRCSVLSATQQIASGATDRVWVTKSGTTEIKFHRELLADLDLRVSAGSATAWNDSPKVASFTVQTCCGLTFGAQDDDYEQGAEGTLALMGGAILELPDGSRVPLADFQIRPVAGSSLFEVSDAGSAVWFTLDHVQINFQRALRKLFLLNMDLRIARAFAQRIKRPELEGLAVGEMNIALEVDAAAGPASAPSSSLKQGFLLGAAAQNVDVELTALSSLQQMARTPGGRVALSNSTMLKNIGTTEVPWYWAISPAPPQSPVVGQHPYLVLHLYRHLDGVIQQIGRSDVKHAFYATNTGCNQSGGQILHPGCSDVYGIGNNSDQFYFGPRSEVTAHTGEWQSAGSHFDGTPVDNRRDHSSHSDAYTHRLTVAEADLQTAGAEYFLEAWYVVAGDVNIFNSMGHRRVTPTLSGSVWTFAFDTSLTAGPAIHSWVNPASPPPGRAHASISTSEGHLQFSVRTTDRGGGTYRYEYALMNLDYDRQIRSVAIPISSGADITNLTFRDVDSNSANDWEATVGDDRVLWQTPAADPAANALDWGTLFSFGFDANIAPADDAAVLGALEAGSDPTLTAATKAPRSQADLAAMISDAPDPLITGANLTYTVLVSNNGPNAAAAVVWTHLLPAKAVLVSAESTQGECSSQDGVVTCLPGMLAVNATATITITVTPFTTGTLSTIGSVTSAEVDPVPANNGSTASTVVPDTDGDGLPDFFESANDLDPNLAADAGIDLDGDGLNNLQEFLAGTELRDPTSVLAISAIERTATAVVIRFATAPRRVYRVQSTDDLQGGVWTPVIDMPSTNGAGEVRGTGHIEQVEDVAPEESDRFYRVQLLP